MTFSDYDIDTGRKITGQVQTICPKCSHDRRKKNSKCLSVNIDKGIWNCHHCGWHGSLSKKQYVLPTWENRTQLSDKVVEWFLQRNINQDVLTKMQISESNEFMPQVNGERKVICFPYLRNGIVTNIKYRTSDKHFKMVKDAELIFYNLDSIKDSEEVTIVEGEIDALTLIQLGYNTVVSVPNGASKGTNNLQYLDNCYHNFERIKTVIIATDNDEPGNALALELARRIGMEKCTRAIPGEFKDANEMFCKTGKLSFEYKPFPIEGIFSVDDHWQALLDLIKNGFPKGWKPRGRVGNHISFHPGYTTIITGIPGHGKSEVIDQFTLQISLDYDLRGAFFSPENRPTEMHLLKIIEKLIGRSVWKMDATLLNKAKEYLNERLFWIYPDDGYTLDNILEKARQAVVKFGINWFVIDPWNKLEHQYTESETKHVSESLDKIANFNHKNMTHCFIVAHPTKMKMIDLKYEVPGLYDISGSANFYNKADLGLTMYKESEGQNTFYIQKVKFKYWGEGIGSIPMQWDNKNGRYTEYGFDPTNWLEQTQPASLINFAEPISKKDEPF
jgi:twinkle protein